MYSSTSSTTKEQYIVKIKLPVDSLEGAKRIIKALKKFDQGDKDLHEAFRYTLARALSTDPVSLNPEKLLSLLRQRLEPKDFEYAESCLRFEKTDSFAKKDTFRLAMNTVGTSTHYIAWLPWRIIINARQEVIKEHLSKPLTPLIIQDYLRPLSVLQARSDGLSFALCLHDSSLYWASEDDQEPDFNQNIRNYLSLLVGECETFLSEHSSSSSSSSSDNPTSSEIATDGAVIALASFFDNQVEKLDQLIHLAKTRKASLFKKEGYATAFINAATFLTSAIITEDADII